MNVTSLRQRLEKLEALGASSTAPQPLHPIAKLLDVLVAYHLGGLAGSDSIATGMARGLGYDSPQIFRAALLAGSESPAGEDLNARRRDAKVRLFALKGAVPDCDGPTFGGVVEALFYEMPEEVQHHSFLSPDNRFPEAVYDFLL
ncbi:hypothetical protein [Methylobacterium sp. J-077]|uniref:hypothetical protein n=1 Tax=Methylobacterium sp. J-077 TaxID=2836656 RepID=UPI001FB869F9|nr:hypothetical protein [Methylobacterium sp. J-077]MCJ2121049.1 hypothetical protein [Methylobacterium sp. J-077]